MNIFHSHGYFITAILLVGMLCLSIIAQQVAQTNKQAFNYGIVIFLFANLALILVMTMTPVPPHIPTADEIYWLNQPRPPFFPNGWRWNSAWQDTGANILLMLPLACGLALKITPAKALLATMGLSGSIEIFQHFYRHGRTSQISDFLLNSLGGLIGMSIALLGTHLHQRFKHATTS